MTKISTTTSMPNDEENLAGDTNALDDASLIERVKTTPWRELSLVGAHITESTLAGKSRSKDPPIRVLHVHLAWVEDGAMADEYHGELSSAMDHDLLEDWLGEIAGFSRGAIPIAWGKQSRSVLHDFLRHTSTDGFDPGLSFLLRKKSRWLDPSIWVLARTGKLLTLEATMKAVGLVQSHSAAIDVAALAYALPVRPDFPVKPDWTAIETCDWQIAKEAF